MGVADGHLLLRGWDEVKEDGGAPSDFSLEALDLVCVCVELSKKTRHKCV